MFASGRIGVGSWASRTRVRNARKMKARRMYIGKLLSVLFRTVTPNLRRRWCCLNGVLDSSGFGGCEIRRVLFAPFPAVKAPSNSERSEDPVLSRATDFWFLCCEDEPVICLETSGRA